MKLVKPLSSADQLELLKSNPEPLILYFSTPNCSVCHAMLPKLLSALENSPYEVIGIDAATFPEIAGQVRIFVAPTVLIFYEGREVLRESRFIDIPKITRLLQIIQAD
jgi:thioredoxin-like negative regulator of GroEL